MSNVKKCNTDPSDICGATSILIRESFMDWESEHGGTWYFERTDTKGEPSPIITQGISNQQYDRASRYLINCTVGWVYFVAKLVSQEPTPLPSLTQPSQGEDALVGQFNSFGVLPLIDPHRTAYILYMKKAEGARYQGIQLGDFLFNAFDYCRRQTSLTMEQAVPSSDGWYHFVISKRDPKVANWLDPSGATTLVTCLRWQGLQLDSVPEEYHLKVKRVDFNDIRKEFPVDEPVFNAALRKEQLVSRQKACLTKPRSF